MNLIGKPSGEGFILQQRTVNIEETKQTEIVSDKKDKDPMQRQKVRREIEEKFAETLEKNTNRSGAICMSGQENDQD